VFGPDDKHVWYCLDYNQLEIRIMAKASGDANLTRLLREGGDQHQLTADAINDLRINQLKLPPLGGDLSRSRKIAKNINFAWQYGAGVYKLSAMAGIDVESFRQAMCSAYPGVVAFMERTIAEADQTGCVHTLYGYRLPVPANESYKGINYIVQGTAGDVCKNAMLACDTYIREQGLTDSISLILTIHDELIFEARKDLPTHHVEALQDIASRVGEPIGCVLPAELKTVPPGASWADKA
jgi:DNA polymerase-1